MFYKKTISKLFREYKQFEELSILKNPELKDLYPKSELKLFKLIDTLSKYFHKFESILKKKESIIQLLVFSIGLSCIICCYFLNNPLSNSYLRKRIIKTMINFHINNHFITTLLLFSIGLFSISAVYLRRSFNNWNNKNIYILWTIFTIITAIFCIFTKKVHVIILIFIITWLIFSIVEIMSMLFHWISCDPNTSIAKLTFIWGIILAILGYFLKGKVKY